MTKPHLNFEKVHIEIVSSNGAFELINACKKMNIPVVKLTEQSDKISFFIDQKNIYLFRKLSRKYRVKAKINGNYRRKIFRNDGWTILALIAYFLPLLFFPQFLWDIQIQNSSPELEDKIMVTLKDDLQINRGALLGKLPNATYIRQLLLSSYSELSWVFIERRGSQLLLILQYAPIVEKNEDADAMGHLVARDSGVVTHWMIEQGEKRFKVNDTVSKGEILVSGIVQAGDKEIIVGAKGKVFVDYWLETSFSIPKQIKYDERVWIGWKFHSFQIPSRFNEPMFSINELFSVEKVFKTETHIVNIDEESLESYVLPLLEMKMLKILSENTVIKAEKLLHTSIQDDTVNGKVLFLINENIAQLQPFQ